MELQTRLDNSPLEVCSEAWVNNLNNSNSSKQALFLVNKLPTQLLEDSLVNQHNNNNLKEAEGFLVEVQQLSQLVEVSSEEPKYPNQRVEGCLEISNRIRPNLRQVEACLATKTNHKAVGYLEAKILSNNLWVAVFLDNKIKINRKIKEIHLVVSLNNNFNNNHSKLVKQELQPSNSIEWAPGPLT